MVHILQPSHFSDVWLRSTLLRSTTNHIKYLVYEGTDILWRLEAQFVNTIFKKTQVYDCNKKFIEKRKPSKMKPIWNFRNVLHIDFLHDRRSSITRSTVNFWDQAKLVYLKKMEFSNAWHHCPAWLHTALQARKKYLFRTVWIYQMLGPLREGNGKYSFDSCGHVHVQLAKDLPSFFW